MHFELYFYIVRKQSVLAIKGIQSPFASAQQHLDHNNMTTYVSLYFSYIEYVYIYRIFEVVAIDVRYWCNCPYRCCARASLNHKSVSGAAKGVRFAAALSL